MAMKTNQSKNETIGTRQKSQKTLSEELLSQHDNRTEHLARGMNNMDIDNDLLMRAISLDP